MWSALLPFVIAPVSRAIRKLSFSVRKILHGVSLAGTLGRLSTVRSRGNMKNPMNLVTVVGLALGGVFGVAGTFVAQRNLQAAAWGLDGVALVVATACSP